jgi:hypothetical protein
MHAASDLNGASLQVVKGVPMPSQVLELKPAVSVASVVKRVKSLRIPMWSAAVLLVLAGLYGYVSGRQNPVHHYVPYVGYPLVLDTTTGKACYSSAPKPSEDPSAPTGPAIPLCGK